MKDDMIGGKRMRNKACMRRASTQDMQQGRHKAAIFAALGAVAIGALVLAGAVTGNIWSEASVETAQAEPQDAEAAQTAATQKVAQKAQPEVESVAPAAEDAVKTAQASAKADPVKAEATRTASDKSDSFSPDERIERAVARITAGSTDEKVKKALTVAAREKVNQLDSAGDTLITAALPESSAYAPARANLDSNEADALNAIRNVDKSKPAAAARQGPEGAAKADAAEDKSREQAAPAPTGPLGQATVSTAVNMRSGMDNKSRVVTTVPASAHVQASQSCQSWCEVVYNGHHGYIYKSFIRHASNAAAAATPATPAKKTAAAKNEADTDGGILAQTGNANELAKAAERAQQRSR